jgi:hypothetical protein
LGVPFLYASVRERAEKEEKERKGERKKGGDSKERKKENELAEIAVLSSVRFRKSNSPRKARFGLNQFLQRQEKSKEKIKIKERKRK